MLMLPISLADGQLEYLKQSMGSTPQLLTCISHGINGTGKPVGNADVPPTWSHNRCPLQLLACIKQGIGWLRDQSKNIKC